MADYINKNILCQAYVHIEESELTDAEMELFKQELKAYAVRRGKFFFEKDAEATVDHKDGSDILYVTIIGGIYAVLKDYDNIRSGVISVSRDARRLTDSLISECLFGMRSKQHNAIRIEARTGVFGKLDGFIAKFDTIKAGMAYYRPSTTIRRMDKVQKQVSLFLYKIPGAKDREYIRGVLREIAIDSLPQSLPTQEKYKPNEEEKRLYRVSRKAIFSTLE